MQALQVQDSALVASTLAIDNIAMALYFAAMALVPAPQATPRAAASAARPPTDRSTRTLRGLNLTTTPDRSTRQRTPTAGQGRGGGALGRAAAAVVTLCAAAACCAAGNAAAVATGGSGFGLAYMAVIAVGVSAAHGWALRRGIVPRGSWMGDNLFTGMRHAHASPAR